MDDVRVHRDCPKPARVGALAFTKGSDIHLAPGQEQHLAHEAWHVVQQKQGRVRPTLRMNGVSINDEPNLEREADVIGRRAMSGMADPTDRPLIAVTGMVVQRVLLWKHGRLPPLQGTESEAVSACARDADNEWILRPDGKLADAEIHVLNASRKYILGERHDDEDTMWRERTAPWPTISTMREEFNAMPGQRVVAGGEEEEKEPEGAPVKDQALESTPAITLSFLLYAQAMLNVVSELGGDAMLPEAVEAAKEANQGVGGSIALILENQLPKYEQYLRSAPSAGASAAPSNPLLDFSSRMVGEYGGRLKGLLKAAGALGASESPKAAAAAIGAMQNARTVLQDIATDLLGFLQAPQVADAAQARATALTFAAPGDSDRAPRAEAASHPYREWGMISNIKAAKAPLFVQVGEDHLEALAAGVGDEAVAVSMNDDFDEVTKRTGAPGPQHSVSDESAAGSSSSIPANPNQAIANPSTG